MVENHDDNQDPAAEQPRRLSGNHPTARQTPPLSDRTPTDQVRERASSNARTAPVQKLPGNKSPSKPPTRGTQMLSLEPPKRKTMGLSREVRLDTMGGPRTLAQRNQTLMGKIGREKTGKIVRPQPTQEELRMDMGKPVVKRTDKNKAVDLGANSRSDMETMMRRKATRRIPKPGGGIQSDDAPLASMESGGKLPVVDGQRRPTGPTTMPPRVNVAIPQSPGEVLRRPNMPPPPPASRGNTLTGISAEDLLGAEGRKVLDEIRKREAEARARGEHEPPFRYGGKVQPAWNDSSRAQFQNAENAQGDEALEPQNFLAGPTRVIRRDNAPSFEVPPPSENPPPDDLGYERPVDFGGQAAPAAATDEDPVARESIAQDEMEQRAGYMMWLQGVITLEEVEESLKGAGPEVSPEVRELLMHTGFTEQITLYRFLARHESLALVDFDLVEPAANALAALRPAIARAYRVVPFAKLGELLLVAAAFPFDPRRLLEIRRLTASKVKLYVATEEEIDAALELYYGAVPSGAHTGEGAALARKYDPTLTGEESGLYAPANTPIPGNVELAELDYAGGGVGSDSGRAGRTHLGDSGRSPEPNDTLDNDTIAAAQRTDQGKTDEVNAAAAEPAISEAEELDLGTTMPPKESGPEDHDPFRE